MTRDQVIALAGLMQALRLVRRMAEHGDAPQAPMRTSLESVFRIDADSTEAVFGGVASLRYGLDALRDLLHSPGSDAQMLRLAVNLLQVERKFLRRRDLGMALREGLRSIEPSANQHGADHPLVIDALGGLYAQTLSTLPVRISVRGNPQHLARPECVATVRALLLAAVRAAVLWRQLGGRPWKLVWQRGRALAIGDDLIRR
ncbi:MAG TPA: high frequency lysogenization protein HflD [Xanthomonadaceae bacterium]|nr:high frequency lysogenization protein HflD [Xanthomonadaceae bacterium]